MFNIQSVKSLLDSKRITQIELANAIGVTKTTVNNFLQSRTKLDVDTLSKIAKALEVPVSYFFEDAEDGKKIIQNSNNVSIGSANSNNNTYADKDLSHKLELCNKELLAAKREIELKNEIIELLKNKKL